MIFYGDPESSTDRGLGLDTKSLFTPRRKTFRGLNGLFFVLFVLRTAVPLVVASTLFGVSATTGGRAFTTWASYLRSSLRPYVRLPQPHDVESTAPLAFDRKDLAKVVLVLDATELETVRVWQTDAAHALFSTYKHRPTANILIGITPGGAICYVSDMYGGRLSDCETVKQSGLLEDLRAEGFCVMADRGFNSIASLLNNDGIGYVAPPSKRKGEAQFTKDDAQLTKDVANIRIHVERAIGALKQWGICDTKFGSTSMDIVPMCFEVCAGLVNLLRRPFASVG